jgi:AraC-like DNA-binding protein
MADAEVRAWRPALPGVAEVLHAYFEHFSYPMHAHATWTLLLLEEGHVHYDLDRREWGAGSGTLTLLPPHVPHNGSPSTATGFRKKVIYLHEAELPAAGIGAAADSPGVTDPRVVALVARTHAALTQPGAEFEAETRFAVVKEQLRRHLDRHRTPDRLPVSRLAHDFRDLLDAHVVTGITLPDAASQLHAHPAHLVRSFSREFGIAPHQYLLTRRVDHARGLILAGNPLSAVASDAGFYDQAHLSRSFKRVLGITPGRYAGAGRSAR